MKMFQDSQDSAGRQFSTEISHELHSDQQNRISEVPVLDRCPTSISSNRSRRITQEDVEVVQNLIERCLQLYLNRDEVIKILLSRAKIEPAFTNLVWQKLEEQNADFFNAYYIRLKLKQQIDLFNQLLEHQYHLMKHSASPKVPLTPMQNGIDHMSVNNLPMRYSVMPQPPVPSRGLPQIDSMGSMSSCQVVNGIPAPGNFHPMQIKSAKENAADTVPVIPPSGIKSEMPSSPASVAANSQFPYTSSEMSGLSVDTSAIDSTFTSDMTYLEGLELGVAGSIGNSKESLQSSAQIPWNFSLSDLTAGLPDSEDVGVPFLPSGSDVLLDSLEQNDIVEEFFVDTVPGRGSQLEEKS